MAFICEPCDRTFGTQGSLQQHLQNSPWHNQYPCTPCDRVFKTQDGLRRHLQSSPRHKKNQHCEICDRHFNTFDSLQAHLRDSDAHKNAAASIKTKTNANQTPLDRFFLSFPSFNYDPSLSPATSHKLLREHMAWPKGSPDGDWARRRYRKALVAEVRIWFGDENDLQAWHTLCRAIGVKQPPNTISSCVSVVRNTHINIVDLIEWGRAGGSDDGVTVFRSEIDLREYTIETEKYFPQDEVKNEQGERNVVLRHLLRKILKSHAGRVKHAAVMISVDHGK